MQYEPKMLKNPTNRVIEFMYDGEVEQVKPGASRLFSGEKAYHALNMVNTGLVEVQIQEAQEQVERDGTVTQATATVGVEEKAEVEEKPEDRHVVAPEDMGWHELRQYAAEKGVYEVGMSRERVLAALAELG